MVRKISDKKTQLIQKLYDEGLDVAEITRRVDVSYSTAYGYTKLKQRINPETGQAFESISQLRDYQARQRINPETRKAFESRSRYYDYQARHMFNSETGLVFESRSRYQEYRARHRINPETGLVFESRSQLMDYQARQKINPETGLVFESRRQYQEHLYKQGQKRPENKVLRGLIERRLKELRKNQSWLSWQIGVSRETASIYTHGKSIPNKKRLERLFSALDVPYRTMEDLLEDKH
jgi:transposase